MLADPRKHRVIPILPRLAFSFVPKYPWLCPLSPVHDNSIQRPVGVFGLVDVSVAVFAVVALPHVRLEPAAGGVVDGDIGKGPVQPVARGQAVGEELVVRMLRYSAEQVCGQGALVGVGGEDGVVAKRFERFEAAL